VTVTAPDGTLFPAPAWADFKNAFSAGAADGYNWFSQNSDFGHWGTYDFQRNGGTFVDAYKSAANYAVGVGLKGAGYSRQDAIDDKLTRMPDIANAFRGASCSARAELPESCVNGIRVIAAP
jgi:hypothetical protein